MKEYRMLETRKGEAEALMNRMAREGWEVVGVIYWSAWKLCLLPGAPAGERRGGTAMKKLLLGLGMLLSGTVGFTGWCMAAVMKVEPGARSRIFGCLYGTDWLLVLFFAAMAAAGLALAVREARRDS